MAAIIKNPYENRITPRLEALSPYQLYLEQIRGVSDNLRYQAQGLKYLPSQFGGIKGQLQTLNAQTVLKLIDFESKGS